MRITGQMSQQGSDQAVLMVARSVAVAVLMCGLCGGFALLVHAVRWW